MKKIAERFVFIMAVLGLVISFPGSGLSLPEKYTITDTGMSYPYGTSSFSSVRINNSAQIIGAIGVSSIFFWENGVVTYPLYGWDWNTALGINNLGQCLMAGYTGESVIPSLLVPPCDEGQCLMAGYTGESGSTYGRYIWQNGEITGTICHWDDLISVFSFGTDFMYECHDTTCNNGGCALSMSNINDSGHVAFLAYRKNSTYVSSYRLCVWKGGTWDCLTDYIPCYSDTYSYIYPYNDTFNS